MQKDSRIFDDFAKLASGAVGTLTDMKREIETIVAGKMEKLLGRMNLVRRDEFDRVALMVEEARAKQEEMVKKIAFLEKALESQGSHEKPASKPPRK